MPCSSAPLLVAPLLLVPLAAHAQQANGIAGSVTDDTGGILPGVTVEVSSPALIEGSRTVFTDGQGNYNAINLIPGTYSVTFTLPGFSTVIREGVVLTAGFTANIVAEMAVGGIEETITVTGASPLVDIQNTVAQQSLTTEQLETLPTGLKAVASSLIALVPGVTGTADVGGTSGLYRANGQSGALFFHGKSDSELLFDGMGIADPNGVSIIYMVNTAFSSETVLETSGGNAESKATLVMNLIPEEGGNRFSGMFDARYSNDSLQADNLDQGLMDQGVTFTNEMLKFYNVDATLGGPIAEDRVWFFAASPRRPQQEHRTRPVLQHQHREPDVRIHSRRESEGVPHGMDAERRRTDHVAGLGEKQDRRLCRLPVVLQSGPGRVLLAGGLRPPVQPLARAVVPDQPGRRRCRAGCCSRPASRTCAAGGPIRRPETGSSRRCRGRSTCGS